MLIHRICLTIWVLIIIVYGNRVRAIEIREEMQVNNLIGVVTMMMMMMMMMMMKLMTKISITINIKNIIIIRRGMIMVMMMMMCMRQLLSMRVSMKMRRNRISQRLNSYHYFSHRM